MRASCRLCGPAYSEWGGQRQAAAAEIEAAQGEVTRVFTLGAAAEQLFFQHVLADDAEIDHAVHHQARDVVVAHAQDIDRHVFGEGDQTLLLQVDLDAAACQQFLGFIAQAARLLHCDP
jgi:diaminopimelate decarboxylase